MLSVNSFNACFLVILCFVIVFNRMSMGHMIAHCHSMSLRLKHFYRFYQVRVWLYFGVPGKNAISHKRNLTILESEWLWY